MNTPSSAESVRRAARDPVREAKRWYWQRISAIALTLCVLAHLGMIVYAVHSGLSGAALLARTRGNLAFGVFYVVFVAACAVHVPLGLACVAEEWLGWAPRVASAVARALMGILAALGLIAVYAMVIG